MFYSAANNGWNPQRVSSRGGLAPSRMERVIYFIRLRLAAPIGLEDMAAVSGLSVERFRKAFKVSTGVSPHRYLMAERLRRATTLLVDTEKPLADVALECGFSCQQHFTAAFRKHVGTPPGAYRRAHRQH